MEFNQTASFDENLKLFRVELEQLDTDCARILFDSLGILAQGNYALDRETIREFNQAVLAALDELPEAPE